MSKVTHCRVNVCGNTKSKNREISFFTFPSEPQRFQRWCDELELDKENISPSSVICQEHFSSAQFTSTKRTRLKKSAVPRLTFRTGTVEVTRSSTPLRKANNVHAKRLILPKAGICGPLLTLKSPSVTQPATVTQPDGVNQNYMVNIHHEVQQLFDVLTVSPPSSDVIQPVSIFSPPIVATTACELQPDLQIAQSVGAVTPTSENVTYRHSDSILQPVKEGSPPQPNTPASITSTPTTSKMKKKLRNLQQRYRTLKLKAKVVPNNLAVTLGSVFGDTSAMKDIMMSQWQRFSSRRKACYTQTEKIAAMTIYYSTTKKGFRTLKKLGLRLPSISSINRWVKKFNMMPGINDILVACLKERIKLLTEREKDCVLMWDEMAIKQYLTYEKNQDIIEGIEDHGKNKRRLVPAKEALVVMIRGLNTNWNFPLSYYFSAESTRSEDLRSILNKCIDVIHEIGFQIRVAVCDQSGTNQGLFGMLGISIETPYYERGGKRIIFVYDTPHIIKNVRTCFKKHSFIIDGQKVLWRYVYEFFEKDITSEQRLAPKLTKYHLEVPDLAKMKVKLATQVFSHSVYAGMKTLIELPETIMIQEDGENVEITNDRKMTVGAIPTANFIKEMDDMFDLLNISERNVVGKPFKSADKIFQNLPKFDFYREWVSRWKTADSLPLPNCIQALQLTLNGVKMLVEDLKEKAYYYVLTRKIQQDCLEHYFSFQRGKNGFCSNPTAKQFRENFRYFLVCNLLSSPTGGNCEAAKSENLLTLNGAKLSCLFSNEVLGQRRVSQPGEFIQSPVSPPRQRRLREERDSSDSEFESSAEDENDETIQSDDFLDFFELSEDHQLDIKDHNVTIYMGGWCVKQIISESKCASCKTLLEFPICERENGNLDDSEILLRNKSFFGDNFVMFNKEMSYGHILKGDTKNVFIKITEGFREAMIKFMNDQGTRICQNVCIWLKRKYDIIRDWLNPSGECKHHRQKMLRLYVNAKVYQLVRQKNQLYKQSRSFRQTRAQLRHQ